MPATAFSERNTLAYYIDEFGGLGDKPALLAMQHSQIERWSYARLLDQTRRLAHGLIQRGITKGDAVALFADNSAEWVVVCMAAIRAGAIVVPLDVQFGENVLKHVLQDSAATMIFTTRNRSERVGKSAPDIWRVLLDADDEHSWRRLLADDIAPLPDIMPQDRAALFYTSGTTGPPKGVPLNHGNLAYQLDFLSSTGLVHDDDRVVLPLPLHHVYPFVLGMFGPLSLGVPLILPKALTGPQVRRALHEGNGTLMVGVPRLYDALLKGILARARAAGRLSDVMMRMTLGLSTALRRYAHLRVGKWLLWPVHRQLAPKLRLLACGGAALPEDLAWRLEGFGWRVATGYGLTETSPLLTINLPGQARFGSAGKPVRGIQLRVDPSAVPGHAKADDKPQGEILARGPSVFSRYHNLPQQSRDAFTEDGWFRTGDVGWIDDNGYVHVSGRVATLIVTRSGENIQPDDIETVYRRHPYIREIVVLQHQDRLVAIIVPDPGVIRRRGLSLDDAIREAVTTQSRQLPSYQRISDYALTRDALPTTHLGKLRRHLLLPRYQGAVKERTQPIRAEGPMPVEEMAAEDRELVENPAAAMVWKWLALRYPHQRLTPDSSPQFDLGLDSMEWLNLTLDIAQRAGVEISEDAIARVETVRDLLKETIEAAESGETAVTEPPWEHPEQALTSRQRRWLRPQGRVLAPLARVLYGLDRLLMHSFFRLRVDGLEHVPQDRAFVLAPNHTSMLDPLVVGAALDASRSRNVYWGGWTGVVFKNSFMRAFSRVARAVPVDPLAAAASSLAFGAAVLKQQKRLVWFPEGGRSRDGNLQDFKPGIGILLAHYAVPVIPVIIRGSREALPPGKLVPRPRKVQVEIGEPLDPQALARQGHGETPQQRIVDALHRIMSEQVQGAAVGNIVAHAK